MVNIHLVSADMKQKVVRSSPAPWFLFAGCPTCKATHLVPFDATAPWTTPEGA